MCKPQTRTLDLRFDGPCSFSVRGFDSACAAFSLGATLRAKIANVLRRLADKTEAVHSLTIVGYGPPQITFDDVMDGATVGFNGAGKYLNDLWRDRVHGSEELRVAAILPNKQIS